MKYFKLLLEELYNNVSGDRKFLVSIYHDDANYKICSKVFNTLVEAHRSFANIIETLDENIIMDELGEQIVDTRVEEHPEFIGLYTPRVMYISSIQI